jgi:hypothetical protein
MSLARAKDGAILIHSASVQLPRLSTDADRDLELIGRVHFPVCSTLLFDRRRQCYLVDLQIARPRTAFRYSSIKVVG